MDMMALFTTPDKANRNEVVNLRVDGCKDVLGMYIGEHETSKFWLTVLN